MESKNLGMVCGVVGFAKPATVLGKEEGVRVGVEVTTLKFPGAGVKIFISM